MRSSRELRSVLNLLCRVLMDWMGMQGCMVLRNMVARNAELRAPLLEKGVETLLRAAKRAYPATCGDVASAALRDLGFDDYLS